MTNFHIGQIKPIKVHFKKIFYGCACVSDTVFFEDYKYVIGFVQGRSDGGLLM